MPARAGEASPLALESQPRSWGCLSEAAPSPGTAWCQLLEQGLRELLQAELCADRRQPSGKGKPQHHGTGFGSSHKSGCFEY